MDMKNKEQLLYFFLQGKISLSQYDYKFMANLQTIIQNQNRVTSNQATLFDNLISKYKKQLTKHGLVKEELKALPWKTDVVDSTPEYTGATISIADNNIYIRVPFNKTFITAFRNTNDNRFEWVKELKQYVAPFSTTSFKLASTFPKTFFPTISFCSQCQTLLDDINKYAADIWKPTLTRVNGKLVVAAINSALAERLENLELEATPKSLFALSKLGVDVHPNITGDNVNLNFAANRHYDVEITDIETVIGWMKNIGCDNVVIGRGLRQHAVLDSITALVRKYGMNLIGPAGFGNLPDGISMLIQHTSSFEVRNSFTGTISKTIVIKDSRPIEVK